MKLKLNKKKLKTLSMDNQLLPKNMTANIAGGTNTDQQPGLFTQEDINFCVSNGRPCNTTVLQTSPDYTCW